MVSQLMHPISRAGRARFNGISILRECCHFASPFTFCGPVISHSLDLGEERWRGAQLALSGSDLSQGQE